MYRGIRRESHFTLTLGVCHAFSQSCFGLAVPSFSTRMRALKQTKTNLFLHAATALSVSKQAMPVVMPVAARAEEGPACYAELVLASNAAWV